MRLFNDDFDDGFKKFWTIMATLFGFVLFVQGAFMVALIYLILWFTGVV